VPNSGTTRLPPTSAAIGGNPHLYADIGKGLHRAFVQRFPYQVFYRIAPDRVNVLAVCHSHADRRNVMKQAFRRERE
jgi:plasmid stabilization system protein ParE